MYRTILTAVVAVAAATVVLPTSAGALAFSGDAYVNEMGVVRAAPRAQAGGQDGEDRTRPVVPRP